MTQINSQQVVFTLTAQCRDCYRCLRVCPVKAIRMHQGQAYVDEQRCIGCGTCIRECPQKAKTFRNDVSLAQKLLDSKCKIAVSIAPSFATVFNEWQIKRLPSALRKMGVSFIGHTAVGAYQVACASLVIAKQKENFPVQIATACPAVVNYVEKYNPELIPYLIPIVSPMMAHAKMLKKQFGDEIKIIFIGPCVAKKTEAQWQQNQGIIDCVLTFKEFQELLEKNNIDLAKCEESDFDEASPEVAQLFPLAGGMLKTAGLDTDFVNLKVLPLSGIDNFKESLNFSLQTQQSCIIEPLFCLEGCINGPAINIQKNVFERKKDVVDYAKVSKKEKKEIILDENFFKIEFEDKSAFNKVVVTEEQINKVLEQTGKSDPKQQLNCGACGYNTCREKAIAVIQGMADPEICIPYMRRLAELKNDRIVEKSPNGIVTLDEKLNIISMNNSFMRFFVCSNAILGKNISYLMDPSPFEKIAEGKVDNLELVLSFTNYNLICHGLFYPLREENQFVGIFVDITNLKVNEKKLEQIKLQTITQAKELLEHQMKTAQSIAKFLGETTARGEELIEKLMSLNENDVPKKN